MGYFYYLLAFLFGLVCVLLMLLILIQKGRGGGLSAAFGGAGGNTAFGAKTGDMLTWVTAGFFLVFILLSIGMVWSTNYLHANATRAVPLLPDEPSSAGGTDGVGQTPVEPQQPATLGDLLATTQPTTQPSTAPTTQPASEPAGAAQTPE